MIYKTLNKGTIIYLTNLRYGRRILTRDIQVEMLSVAGTFRYWHINGDFWIIELAISNGFVI